MQVKERHQERAIANTRCPTMPPLGHPQQTPHKRTQQYRASTPPSSPTEDEKAPQQQHCTKTPETAATTLSTSRCLSSPFQRQRWNNSSPTAGGCSSSNSSNSSQQSSQHTTPSSIDVIVEPSCSSYCGDLEISQRSSTSRTLFSESDTERQEDSVSSSQSIPTVCELTIPEVPPPRHGTSSFHCRMLSESSARSLRSRRSSENSANTAAGHRSRMRRTSSAVLNTAAVAQAKRSSSKRHVVVSAPSLVVTAEPFCSSSSSDSSSCCSEASTGDRSKSRHLRQQRRRRKSSMQQLRQPRKKRLLVVRHLVWIWLAVGGLSSIGLTLVSSRNMMMMRQSPEQEHDSELLLLDGNAAKVNVLFRQLEDGDNLVERPSAGLRGNMLHEVVVQMEQQVKKKKQHKETDKKKEDEEHRHKHKPERKNKKKKEKNRKKHGQDQKDEQGVKKEKTKTLRESSAVHEAVGPIEQPSLHKGEVVLPYGELVGTPTGTFEAQDSRFYRTSINKASRTDTAPRIALMDSSGFDASSPQSQRLLELYPADFTDNTQFYSILDSRDERVSSSMERRPPLADGECVPMQDWQTTFHPSCNGMHELDMVNIGEDNGNDMKLFGTKGYWRNAWRVDSLGGHHALDKRDTIVLKTLKINHRFEEKHFEHDRIDAVAMERLTSSPHVINVFGYCGHSVMTEFADGKRLGELADKAAKMPLSRLRIARDIANGLADVHGIDGEGNATFVHLDINPANVVSVNGTLKLNDFNIGILRRWNTTSNTPCGFPAAFPNPQWRSPEEARGEQHLTEKVDVFSLGHILFRLICEHEPWNKLEPGGRPSKEEMNEKVIKGVLPFIPEQVKTSTDPEVVAIREAMLRCYTYKSEERPSAREIANALQNVLDELDNKSSEA